MRNISLKLSPRSSRERELKIANCLVEQAKWLMKARKQGSEASGTPPPLNILSHDISTTETGVDSVVTSAAFRNSLFG